MKTYARFCAQLDRNSLNVYRGEKNISDKICREKRDLCFMSNIIFLLSLTVFEMNKEIECSRINVCGCFLTCFNFFLKRNTEL
jgi:hypothetical protein